MVVTPPKQTVPTLSKVTNPKPKLRPTLKPKTKSQSTTPKSTTPNTTSEQTTEPVQIGGGDHKEDSSFIEGARFPNFDSFKQSFDIWCRENYHPMKIRDSKKNNDVKSVATHKYKSVMYSCKHYGKILQCPFHIKSSNIFPFFIVCMFMFVCLCMKVYVYLYISVYISVQK